MNKWLSIFPLCALMPMGSILLAQTANSPDNGLSLTNNPDTRHQALTPRKVLRANYKGPKTGVPNVHLSKNRSYSLKPKVTAEPKSGPVTLGHPLTPVPTLAPIIPRDAKGNPVTLWAPGQKINLPTPISRPQAP